MPPKGQKMSQEAKKKMSEAHKGKKFSPETIAKMAAAHIGKKRSPEACAAIGAGRLGIRFSEESRKRVSEAHMGHPVADSTIEAVVKNKNYCGRKVIINGIQYNTMKAASRALGINYKDMVIACRYRPERAKEYGITIDWVEPKGDE